MRTTKAMLANAFQRAATRQGWDITTKRWDDGKARVGSVSLEHNSVYGWNVNQICNEAGGERRLKESCPAAEMLAWLEGVGFGAAPVVFVTIEGGVADVDVEGAATVRLRDYDVTDDDRHCCVRDADGSLCVEGFFGLDAPSVERGTEA